MSVSCGWFYMQIQFLLIKPGCINQHHCTLLCLLRCDDFSYIIWPIIAHSSRQSNRLLRFCTMMRMHFNYSAEGHVLSKFLPLHLKFRDLGLLSLWDVLSPCHANGVKGKFCFVMASGITQGVERKDRVEVMQVLCFLQTWMRLPWIRNIQVLTSPCVQSVSFEELIG